MSWFRDGQVISTSTLPGVQISFSDGRARLTIPAVTKANSGRYSLRATNGSGQATSTAELLVTGRQEGTCPSPETRRPEGVSRIWGGGCPPRTSEHRQLESREGITGRCIDSRVVCLVEFNFPQKVAENYFLYAYIKHLKLY